MSKAFEGVYQGEQAIWLQFGKYEAALIPQAGGNLVAFRDTERNFRFIREPGEGDMEAFMNRPMVHGIPVLFPPNRYEDGKFPWNGSVYRLPVNEANRDNHLHGFFYDIPWQVDDYGSDEHASYVVVAQRVTESHPAYTYFPHRFTIKIRYSLSSDGLRQEVGVRNDGQEAMPCVIGFHTSLNAPFAPGSSPSDCKLRMTIGERIELNEQMLPNGRFTPLDDNEKSLKGDGVSPYFARLDNHYTAVPQGGRNAMELTDTRLGVKFIYDAGEAYRFWMIYNGDANSGFFCPEPQTNMVNAPNAPFRADETGILSLAPGEVWQETSRMYSEG
ncbi:aldose 1-epimerase [Paenibacillus ginsengarvi]|uniref:Aldose 1-epimerase n=1 Tax=Paenibacillus ginsengarvi TaxID=400777 RepID=A0A3B0CI07_9BACL|nr:aldose 1-epimerase [Paenibacillus ginsengarvi]RKN85003.1 aldose 1-epimerase [Paenibacillus ginsengarvi]